MSHLPQSQAHYGCRGNVVCSDLVGLMADVRTEMRNESETAKQPELTVDGAAKQLNEGVEKIMKRERKR